MTDATLLPFDLPSVRRKKLTVDFDGGKVVHAKTLMHGKVSRIHHTGKGVFRDLPTPYDATRALGGRATTRLDVALGHHYLGGGYIFVIQDLRGRFKSEGDYAMYRVPRGAFNRTQTDETTDAWDTIDWLVKKVPGNNGRVGVWGTSYPGWLTLAAGYSPRDAEGFA